MKYQLTLASLGELDAGRVGVLFQQALERVLWDCKDRPGVRDARKVSIQLSIVPCIDEDGDFDACTVSVQTTETIPKRKTRQYEMAPQGKGLVFNELFEHEEEETEEGTL